jgi:ribose transport system substrate-binding protein
MATPRVLSLFLWLIFALLGCNEDKGGPASGPDPARGTKDKPWVIGMSQCNEGEPWRAQMDRDIEAAIAKHDNLKLVLKDAQNDSQRQRAHVEELVAQKIDLLVISPKETQPLTKPVADAFDKGIPVIVLDRRVDGDKFTVFIGADNKKIGKAAGAHALKLLGGKGNVVELEGLMTSSPGQDRHSGFREGLALDKNPDVKVVFEADMKWLEADAGKEMSSALAAHETIDLVYAHNDPGAHGAYLAAKDAGREKNMKFIGIDALPHEGVEYVKKGMLDATFLYPTGGAEAVDTALKILKGEKVDKEITLGTKLFTKDNVEKGGEELK